MTHNKKFEENPQESLLIYSKVFTIHLKKKLR